jgi:hypothetical protein
MSLGTWFELGHGNIKTFDYMMPTKCEKLWLTISFLLGIRVNSSINLEVGYPVSGDPCTLSALITRSSVVNINLDS